MSDRDRMLEARRRREEAKVEAARRFGEWLEGEMTARGMSNVDLQGEIGINNSTIGFWRRGVRMPDDWATLRMLADVMETPAPQLAVLIGFFRPEELGGIQPPVSSRTLALQWVRTHPEESLEALHDWIQREPQAAMAKVMLPIAESSAARRQLGIRGSDR
ncbi:helix-turn-helix domain-containing protein [Actinomadura violacea]|uniref:Helix-turn-helix transcriptional regulator n=1 Tax=Actinomadura violacea TaxID=2819934 RepID=A0ABS3RWJ6_9ACTN|nr:helix-turn-helix transcriptional regulator [Actinomadura violacea]MBO2461120.1 helix-turn-helix transcriptional regulator [Actinomadura violacea]